jgi:spore coat protein U-like protein
VPLSTRHTTIEHRRRRRRVLAWAWAVAVASLAGLAMLAPGRADAAADCSVTTSGLAFGVYDPTISTPDDSTGSVTVTCNYTGGSASGVSYTIAFSSGNSGSFSQRRLVAGTLQLGYNLFSDAGRTVVLGNGTGGTSVFTGGFTVGPGVGNGTRTGTHTVYGRIPALQAVEPGNYADPIIVTLTF